MTAADLSNIIANMGRLRGAVKAEAESYMGVNSSGTPCVSIRHSTANDLLQSLAAWEQELATLFHDKPTIEEEIG
jgi:hypothetical protein